MNYNATPVNEACCVMDKQASVREVLVNTDNAISAGIDTVKCMMTDMFGRDIGPREFAANNMYDAISMTAEKACELRELLYELADRMGV